MDEFLLKEWDFEKNHPLNPYQLSNQSNKVVFWKCQNGHSWNKKIQSRYLYNTGCPTCKSVAYLFPEIANQIYRPETQSVDPNRLSFGSNKKIEWICDHGHRWKASVQSRTTGGYNKKGTDCPYCSNKRVSSANNLQAVNPVLCKEWDFQKNKKLPEQVLAGSHKKFGGAAQTVILGKHQLKTGALEEQDAVFVPIKLHDQKFE